MSAADTVPGMLTVKDTMTLEFERGWWKYTGAKEAAIRDHFTESPTRYYQRLGALIERPDAAAFDILTVKRLRRLREARTRARSSRRDGIRL